MELSPYISVRGAPSPLPVGAIVAGLVREILDSNRYLVQVRGILLELEIPLTLQKGEEVSFRVRGGGLLDIPIRPATPGRLEPADARQILKRLGLPAGEEPERLLRAFLRMNAPIDREGIEAAMAAVRSSRGEARFEAAAFLASHGIEPQPELVTRLARVGAPETLDEPVSPHPLLTPFREALETRAPASSEVLRKLIEASPRLRLLDRAIELAAAAVPADEPDPAPRLAEALRIVREVDEKGFARFREILRLPAAMLYELRARLLELEREAIASMPELREAREARGAVFENHDRIWAHRLVNQLARLQDERAAIIDVPIRQDGRVVHVPIRVIRREGGGGREAQPRFHVTLETDLSRLGPVRTRIDSTGTAMSVRFQVRRAEARRHLETGHVELADALRSQGWQPSVTTEVAVPPAESPFSVFEKPGPVLGVDVRA